MKTPIPVLSVFLPLLAVLAACAPPVGQEEQGNLTVFLPGGGRAIAGDILESLEYRLTFLHRSSGERRNAVIPRGRESITLNLALGGWTVHADAYLKDDQLFGSGDAEFRMLAGRTNSVFIDMSSVFLTSVEAVEKALVAAGDWVFPPGGGGETADDPVRLAVSLDLEENWDALIGEIEGKGKYVALDLSASTMGPGVTEYTPSTGPVSEEFWIVSLVLPNTVTSIASGNYSPTAFEDFKALKSVEGRAVTSVGGWAFSESVIESVSLPAAIEIDGGAFLNCASLISVDLPRAVTIGGDAFNGCTSLQSVSLPAAKTIKQQAFDGCIGLESVSLPAATDISVFAFKGCTSLESVSLFAATEIGSGAFYECANLSEVSLPAADKIGDQAFYGCESLSEVSLPVATDIGANAFEDCSSLGINWGDTVPLNFPAAKTIGNKAFHHCIALNSVYLPNAVEIGEEAFYKCDGLESVSLPAATDIKSSAFRECFTLSEVNLPVATTIGNRAFGFTGTTELTVTLGAAAPALGMDMFFDVTGTKPVTVKVPAGAGADYGFPFANNDTTDENWGNAFRGAGWNEEEGYLGGTVNTYITLTITEIQAP